MFFVDHMAILSPPPSPFSFGGKEADEMGETFENDVDTFPLTK